MWRLDYRLFVYGTLIRGQRNHRLLARARPLGPACTAPRFALHDLGRFPAMVSGGRNQVIGELYAVDGVTLAMLDNFEGHPRFFRRETVMLADGGTALAYLLPPGRVRGFGVVASGDWRDRSPGGTPRRK